jgi:DNA-binding LytR/AlgR family response regulator
VVGDAGDGMEALRLLGELEPDALLLDICMPGLDGLALTRQGVKLPPVIFVTAHERYAVQAFEVQAVDYLLKPVQQDRLVRALERVRALRGKAPGGQEAPVAEQVPAEARLTVKDGEVLHVFDARQITRFWASEKYTVFQQAGREYLLEDSLNELEERLAAHDFLRVHRAELVNLHRVRALRPGEEGAEVELEDGQVARVSRRNLGALKRALRLEDEESQ